MLLGRSLRLCARKKHCTAGTDSNRLTAKGKTAGSGNRFLTGGREGGRRWSLKGYSY